jgi:hypothetical protein
MRRVAFLGFLVSTFVFFLVVGCGNDSQSQVGEPAKVELSPTTLSLNKGEVAQVATRVLDANDRQIFTATITFNVAVVSGTGTLAEVSKSGLVCAGDWDSLDTPIVCTATADNPSTPAIEGVGVANITATATSSSGTTVTSAPLPVNLHERIDRIDVTGGSAGCVSQGATAPANTALYTAIAKSNDPAVCSAIGQTAPCDLGDVGTFIWSSSQPGVGKIDTQPTGQPANQLTVTAGAPGRSQISANISGVVSAPAAFATCSPGRISIRLKDPPTAPDTETSFAVAAAATKPLTADVVDVNGVAFTSTTFLTWSASQPAAASVNSSGVVTGVAPGTSSIVASCTPPSCNAGLTEALYSNVVTASVSGTSAATTVYVTTTAAPASGDHSSLIPIDTSNNTAGTASALPTDATINSLVFNRPGTRAFLGSDKGLIVIDLLAGTIGAPLSAAPGKVLAAAPDGITVIVSDAANSDPTKRKVYVVNAGSGAIQDTLAIADATAAAFTPESFRAFIAAGNKLFVYSPNTALQNLTLGGTANDVAALVSGAFAYTASPGIDVANTCNRSLATNLGTGSPEKIAATALPVPAPDEGREQVIAVDSPNVRQIDVDPSSSASSACPPTPSHSTASYTFTGIAGFVPRQIIVTSDQQKVIILSDQSSLLVYSVGTTAGAGSTSTIPLDGGAIPFSGGATLDGKTLYVGASDNAVHRIDLTANSGAGDDVQQIPISFTPANQPDLVAVRPR